MRSGRSIWILVLLSILHSTSPGAGTEPPVEFKLIIRVYALGETPLGRSELIVQDRHAYHFAPNSDEILLIDSASKRVELFDLKRRIQTRVTFQELDNALKKHLEQERDRARRLESEGGKANRVEAKRIRNLCDPAFQAEFDETKGRLRLSNPASEIEIVGRDEPDASRRAVIFDALNALIKLSSYREVTGAEPFTKLEAIWQLGAKTRLRPIEMICLYRLGDERVRLRWTYQLVPELTDRERRAASILEQFRAKAPLATFKDYEEVFGDIPDEP